MDEVDGGQGDTKWKWEMNDDEILVRIALAHKVVEVCAAQRLTTQRGS